MFEHQTQGRGWSAARRCISRQKTMLSFALSFGINTIRTWTASIKMCLTIRQWDTIKNTPKNLNCQNSVLKKALTNQHPHSPTLSGFNLPSSEREVVVNCPVNHKHPDTLAGRCSAQQSYKPKAQQQTGCDIDCYWVLSSRRAWSSLSGQQHMDTGQTQHIHQLKQLHRG